MRRAGTRDHRTSLFTEYERAVATWTFNNNKHAGASTHTLPEAQCLYLAVRAGNEVFGVVGIDLKGRVLEAFEHSIVPVDRRRVRARPRARQGGARAGGGRRARQK
ncbi:MAG: hypothetical protein ACLTSX_07450 [Collinsella sp.]